MVAVVVEDPPSPQPHPNSGPPRLRTFLNVFRSREAVRRPTRSMTPCPWSPWTSSPEPPGPRLRHELITSWAAHAVCTRSQRELVSVVAKWSSCVSHRQGLCIGKELHSTRCSAPCVNGAGAACVLLSGGTLVLVVGAWGSSSLEVDVLVLCIVQLLLAVRCHLPRDDTDATCGQIEDVFVKLYSQGPAPSASPSQ